MKYQICLLLILTTGIAGVLSVTIHWPNSLMWTVPLSSGGMVALTLGATWRTVVLAGMVAYVACLAFTPILVFSLWCFGIIGLVPVDEATSTMINTPWGPWLWTSWLIAVSAVSGWVATKLLSRITTQ